MVRAYLVAKDRPIKPYSKAFQRGSLGTDIDGRSIEGRFIRKVELELLAQIGPNPTFAQQLCVRRIARLMLQAEIFDKQMTSGSWSPHDSRVAAGINNAVLRALREISLKAKPEKVRSRLAEHFSQPVKAAQP